MTMPYTDLKPKTRAGGPARSLGSDLPEGLRRRLEESKSLIAEPFRGVTADGTPTPGLFSLQATGVPTDAIPHAAEAFLSTLAPEQRDAATFDVDSDAWRQWCNVHPFLMRHGMSLDDMTVPQRDAALGVVAASLSERGFKVARDVMKLNEHIREITGKDNEYGEWLYWMSIMGTPSTDEPWGWQIDGHHLIINCMMVGDQIVTTPAFLGSEPVDAQSGKHKGTRVFHDEESNGLALISSLTKEQLAKAVISDEMPSEVFTTAFRDNFELHYEGIRYGDLASDEQKLLMSLIGTYVSRERAGHAELRMEEVRRHLDQTYFAWMGATDKDAVFYYRVHSPVILIEFDHQRGVALDNDMPTRNHVHSIVRTPNGNDYGKDLLRQHREQAAHEG